MGFDDNRELDLEGAHSALPIWTEFMKRATEHREYRNVTRFPRARGNRERADRSGFGHARYRQLPYRGTEYFIDGTQPVGICPLHGGSGTRVASWEAVPPVPAVPPSSPARANPAPPPQNGWPAAQQRASQTPPPPVDTTQTPPAVPAAQPTKEHKGILGRIRDIFK